MVCLFLLSLFSVLILVTTTPASATSPSPSTSSSLAQECAAQLSQFDGDPLPEFVSWLKAFPDLEMEQIDIQVINGERGVVAKHAIEAGSVILHLPSSALISDHTMFSDPYWSERGEVFKQMMEVDAFIPMALRLWHEAYDYQQNTTPQLAGHAPTRCSPYLPWLRMLPHNYTTPPYMGNDDFDLIERLAPGSSITAELRYQSSNLFITYTYVMRHVYNAHPHLFKAKPNWEQFRRFHQTVRTRCWNDHLMAPFLDMLNHDSDMRSPRYNHDTHEFHLYASRDLLPGDEIYQSYGRITDRETMLAYGFVATKNTHNTVEVDIDWQEAEYPSLALHFNLSNTITFMSGDLLPLDTLRVVRVFSITSDDNSLYSDIDVPMSSKNEMEMFRRLLKICHSQLAIYSTTIEQDQALLQSSSLPYIHRTMVLYVMHQKQLLYRVIDEITRRFWTCTARVCEFRDSRRYMSIPNRLFGKWQARDCHDCTPTCQC